MAEAQCPRRRARGAKLPTLFIFSNLAGLEVVRLDPFSVNANLALLVSSKLVPMGIHFIFGCTILAFDRFHFISPYQIFPLKKAVYPFN